MSAVKDQFHSYLANCDLSKLNEIASINQDLRLDLYCQERYIEAKADILISKIYGVQGGQSFTRGHTWEELFNTLHFQGWNETAHDYSVIDYFDDEVYSTEFPAKGAKRYLEISVYGGAALCQNGQHRLVAGMIYLGSKYGELGRFKGVKTNHLSVEPSLKPILLEAHKSNATVSATLDSPLVLNSRHPNKKVKGLFKVSIDRSQGPKPLFSFLPIHSNKTFYTLFKDGSILPVSEQELPNVNKYQWKQLPSYVLTGLLDDSWVKASN